MTVVTVKALTGNKANAGRGDLRMELNNSGGPGKEGSRDRGGRPARTVEIVTVGRKRGRDSGGAGGRCPRGDHDERTNDVDQMKKADISEIHGQE